jgi:hypothetical protein
MIRIYTAVLVGFMVSGPNAAWLPARRLARQPKSDFGPPLQFAFSKRNVSIPRRVRHAGAMAGKRI